MCTAIHSDAEEVVKLKQCYSHLWTRHEGVYGSRDMASLGAELDSLYSSGKPPMSVEYDVGWIAHTIWTLGRKKMLLLPGVELRFLCYLTLAYTAPTPEGARR
jgi:hypothetical protein